MIFFAIGVALLAGGLVLIGAGKLLISVGSALGRWNKVPCPKCGAKVDAAELAEREARHHDYDRVLGPAGRFVDAMDGQLLPSGVMCGCCGTRRRE